MPERSISNTSATLKIIGSTLGGGITYMPLVFCYFKNPLMGFLLMFFVGLITFHALYSLSYAAGKMSENDNKHRSYGELAREFSSLLYAVVEFSLLASSLVSTFSFLQMFFTIVSKIIFSNESLDHLISKHLLSFLSGIRVCFAVALGASLYFLIRRKDLSSLDFMFVITLFCCSAFVVFVAAFGIFAPVEPDFITSYTPPALETVIGLVVLALHCQFNYLDVYNMMKNKSLSNVAKVNFSASILAALIYSTVGYLGFRAFGGAASNNSLVVILADKESAVSQYLKANFNFFCGSLVPRLIALVYVPIFLGGTVFSLHSSKPTLKKLFAKVDFKRSEGYTVLLCTLFVIFSGAFEVKNVDDFLACAGNLFTGPISFVFPAIFACKTTGKYSNFYFVSKMIVIVTLIILGYLTYKTIFSLSNN